MRLGKFVEHFKAAALAADSKQLDPIVKYLAVGRQLGYAFYMTFDALTYVDQVGIRKFDGAARLQKEAYRAWLAGLLCNVVAGVYALYNNQLEVKKQKESSDAEKAVEVKKLERLVHFWISIDCDVLICVQGAIRNTTAAHLRSLRLHCPKQRFGSRQFRRRDCWFGRYHEQLDWIDSPMGEDSVVFRVGLESPKSTLWLLFPLLGACSTFRSYSVLRISEATFDDRRFQIVHLRVNGGRIFRSSVSQFSKQFQHPIRPIFAQTFDSLPQDVHPLMLNNGAQSLREVTISGNKSAGCNNIMPSMITATTRLPHSHSCTRDVVRRTRNSTGAQEQ
jgi:hypothetical protein